MRILALIAVLALSGCASWTPQEKTAAWVGFAVAAIAISKDGDKPAMEIGDPVSKPCYPQPDGSCR